MWMAPYSKLGNMHTEKFLVLNSSEYEMLDSDEKVNRNLQPDADRFT